MYLHRHVKVKTGNVRVLLLNKATSQCFVNLSQIFKIFSILVNDNIVYMPHNFGCYENHFGGKICVTIDIKLLHY